MAKLQFTRTLKSWRSRWDAFWNAFAGLVRNKNSADWRSQRNLPLFPGVDINSKQLTRYLAWRKKLPSVVKKTPVSLDKKIELSPLHSDLLPFGPQQFCKLIGIDQKRYIAIRRGVETGTLITDNSEFETLKQLIAYQGDRLLEINTGVDDQENFHPIIKTHGPESPEILAFIKLLLENGTINEPQQKQLMETARLQKKWQVLALFSAYQASQKFQKPFEECIVGLGKVDSDSDYGLKQRLQHAIETGQWEIAELIKSYSAEKEKYFGLAEAKYKAIEDEYARYSPGKKYDILYDLTMEQKVSPENLARIEILLKQGTERGRLIWHVAYEAAYSSKNEDYDKWKIVDLFASFPTDEYDRFDYGGALLLAAAEGPSKLAQKLSTAGASVHFTWQGRNGLAWALKNDNIALFEHLLVTHYANASERVFCNLDYFICEETSGHKQLRFVAAIAKHFPMLPGDPCGYGSALIDAVAYGDKERFDILIDAGARKSTRRNTNRALHYAAKNDRIQWFKDLLALNFDPLARNYDGKTAIDVIADRCKELTKQIKAETQPAEKNKLKELRLQWREVFQGLAQQVQEQLGSELQSYQNQSWFSSKHRDRANALRQDVVKEVATVEQKQQAPRPLEENNSADSQAALSTNANGRAERELTSIDIYHPPDSKPNASVKNILTLLTDAKQPLNNQTPPANPGLERKSSKDDKEDAPVDVELVTSQVKTTPRYAQALHNTTKDGYQVIVNNFHRYFKILNRDLVQERAELTNPQGPTLTFGKK